MDIESSKCLSINVDMCGRKTNGYAFLRIWSL